MELWVRSQNKKVLLKISTLEIDIDNSIYTTYSDIVLRLGKYATKERALEVLDEIQNVLQPKILTMKQNSKLNLLEDNLNIIVPDNCSFERIGDIYVYEMPEE